MKTVELGKTGLFVTPVGMGVLTIGRTQLDMPLLRGAAIVRHALESGINFLDTAEYYETYPYIRAAIEGTNFKPVIASKSLSDTYEGMKKAVEDMRAYFAFDVLDIFLLHEVREAPDFSSRAGAWECLREYKARGIIRAIGISTHYTDVAEMNASLKDSDILFPLINRAGLGIRCGAGADDVSILARDNDAMNANTGMNAETGGGANVQGAIGSCAGTKEAMAEAIRRNAAAGKGVFAMKVFGGGNLAGDYLECLDYVRALLGVRSMMVGIGCEQDVDRLVEYAEGTIDRNYRPDLSKKKIRIDQGDCEGCGACVKICPNKAIHMKAEGTADVDHEVCLTCGYCAPSCPVRAIILF